MNRDGELTLVETVSAENPSFLALDPTLTHLYSVNENLAGRVSAYAIDPANGTLAFLNTHRRTESIRRISACIPRAGISSRPTTSGDFPVFRIESNGSIGPMTDEFASEGNAPAPVRTGRKVPTRTRS
jgi:6-phosphogluconolactonase